MKNKIFFKTVALILTVFSLFSVFCTGAFGFNDTLVYDNGALLSDDEEALLQSQLSALSTKYDISLVVVTVDTLGGKTDEEYADDFYDYNDYKDDGALCLLVFSESNAKGENKLYVSTKGTCISAFSDADIDEYCQRVLQYLSDRDFYSVFKEFTNFSDSELSSSGDNSDTNDGYYYSNEYYNSDEYKEYMKGYRIKQTLIRLAIAVVIGAVAGLTGVGVMKSKHKSVKMQTGASRYIKPGSMVLTKSDDIFLYRTVTATPKPKDPPPDSDGGSSTHTSSSGDTHGGGGISF